VPDSIMSTYCVLFVGFVIYEMSYDTSACNVDVAGYSTCTLYLSFRAVFYHIFILPYFTVFYGIIRIENPNMHIRGTRNPVLVGPKSIIYSCGIRS
jgi:hypothetical protein